MLDRAAAEEAAERDQGGVAEEEAEERSVAKAAEESYAEATGSVDASAGDVDERSEDSAVELDSGELTSEEARRLREETEREEAEYTGPLGRAEDEPLSSETKEWWDRITSGWRQLAEREAVMKAAAESAEPAEERSAGAESSTGAVGSDAEREGSFDGWPDEEWDSESELVLGPEHASGEFSGEGEVHGEVTVIQEGECESCEEDRFGEVVLPMVRVVVRRPAFGKE